MKSFKNNLQSIFIMNDLMQRLNKAPQFTPLLLAIGTELFSGFIRPFRNSYRANIPLYNTPNQKREASRVSNVNTQYVFQTYKGKVIRLSVNGSFDRTLYYEDPEPNANYRMLHLKKKNFSERIIKKKGANFK